MNFLSPIINHLTLICGVMLVTGQCSAITDKELAYAFRHFNAYTETVFRPDILSVEAQKALLQEIQAEIPKSCFDTAAVNVWAKKIKALLQQSDSAIDSYKIRYQKAFYQLAFEFYFNAVCLSSNQRPPDIRTSPYKMYFLKSCNNPAVFSGNAYYKVPVSHEVFEATVRHWFFDVYADYVDTDTSDEDTDSVEIAPDYAAELVCIDGLDQNNQLAIRLYTAAKPLVSYLLHHCDAAVGSVACM
jgi:hypothetical protein